MERIAAANNALLGSNDDYGNAGDNTNFGQGRKLNVDLAKFAAALNAVATTKAVTLSAEDLQQPFRECSQLTNRYFPRLRFGASESYPLPTPQSIPYEENGLDGSVRCETDSATVYSLSAPHSEQNFSSCWSRQPAFSNHVSLVRRQKNLALWIRMQWDEEATRWAIYTRADQRTVDRHRVKQARTKTHR